MSKYTKNHYSYDVVEPNVKIGSIQQTFKADYFFTGTELYAIRFKDNKDNLNRTAFRYTVEGSENQKVFKIEAVQIGARALTIENVVRPDFWTSLPEGSIIVRKLPLYGTAINRDQRTAQNKYAYYLTASQYDVASIYTGDVHQTVNGFVTLSRLDRSFPILLFKR